jgi:hypothetical protein
MISQGPLYPQKRAFSNANRQPYAASMMTDADVYCAAAM